MYRRPSALLMLRGLGAVWPTMAIAASSSTRVCPPLCPSSTVSSASVYASCRWMSTGSGAAGGEQGSGNEAGASQTHESSASSAASPTTVKDARKIQIAVVGSGPSGCFVASYLTRKHPSIHVDIFERMPVSFGLSRYGVAPDHPDVKNVEKQFMDLFKSGRATWIGNVSIGKEIPVEAMLQHYAAVVFATGADSSKKLNIPGEDLGGVVAARDVVSYYNTLPFPYGSPRFCPFDLERTSRVVVVGNGNVAMDVTRVMAGSYKYFCETDMNCVALREFMKNRIRQIDVIGRRGVEHSAFAIAEFRELTRYQEASVSVQVDAFDLEAALAVTSTHSNARARKRLMELVHKFTVSDAVMATDARRLASNAQGQPLADPAETTGNEAQPKSESANSGPSPSTPPRPSTASSAMGRGPCTVRFRYHLTPVAVLPSAARKNYVGGLLCERRDSLATTAAAAVDGAGATEKQYCVLPCDLVVKSVGYRSDRVPGIPFSEKEGVIPNDKGRVEGLPRVYCSGWVKNGAKGVILHSVVDAQETVASILEDIESNVIPTEGDEDTMRREESRDGGTGIAALPPLTSHTTTMYGKYGLVDYFVEKKLEPVSVAGLERILHVEQQRGIDLGKRAEKLDAARDMLDIALGGEVGKKADEKVRGVTPARAEAMLYLKELLDDDTDLAPFAREIAKDMPRKLAQQHPTGRIAPTQL